MAKIDGNMLCRNTLGLKYVKYRNDNVNTVIQINFACFYFQCSRKRLCLEKIACGYCLTEHFLDKCQQRVLYESGKGLKKIKKNSNCEMAS